MARAPRDRALPGSPNTSGHSQPVDAGKTQGGGQLGHGERPTAEEETPAAETHLRNQVPSDRDQNVRDREPPKPLPELKP